MGSLLSLSYFSTSQIGAVALGYSTDCSVRWPCMRLRRAKARDIEFENQRQSVTLCPVPSLKAHPGATWTLRKCAYYLLHAFE